MTQVTGGDSRQVRCWPSAAPHVQSAVAQRRVRPRLRCSALLLRRVLPPRSFFGGEGDPSLEYDDEVDECDKEEEAFFVCLCLRLRLAGRAAVLSLALSAARCLILATSLSCPASLVAAQVRRQAPERERSLLIELHTMCVLQAHVARARDVLPRAIAPAPGWPVKPSLGLKRAAAGCALTGVPLANGSIAPVHFVTPRAHAPHMIDLHEAVVRLHVLNHIAHSASVDRPR
eukprot:CAMPEP_0119424338 /NCGR_PEP_ID=MMETSP1335-20130426/32339_1 /TAXON_ID=259385 /ORGANISM="Chrysoculter rhomboideus, Strain RCC1486" /LENGTH=230 /DNA_ID=CAMNT_0007449857 /DNA_START=86 /DNA_END=777 /DNA_ORIENTATION=+